MPVVANLLQAVEAGLGGIQALVNKAVGAFRAHRVLEKLPVELVHAGAQPGEFIAPAFVALSGGKQAEYARPAGFLVLQQLIGNAAVRRNNQDALIRIAAGCRVQHDVVAHRIVLKHGCSANLVYCVFRAHVSSCRWAVVCFPGSYH